MRLQTTSVSLGRDSWTADSGAEESSAPTTSASAGSDLPNAAMLLGLVVRGTGLTYSIGLYHSDLARWVYPAEYASLTSPQGDEARVDEVPLHKWWERYCVVVEAGTVASIHRRVG